MPLNKEVAPPAGLEITEKRTLTAPVSEIEWREDGDTLRFEGHAAVFDSRSEDLGGFVEEIKRGAFKDALAGDPDIRMLWNHNTDFPLSRTRGGTLELREDPKGLRVYSEMAPTTYAKDLRVLLKSGVVSQMSFGFTVKSDAWFEEEDGALVRHIKRVGTLFEVSPVTFPAYPQTDAKARAILGQSIFNEAGEMDIEVLRSLAWNIHRGDTHASDEDRAAIDAALIGSETVSPWMAQQAFRAYAQEPDLRGVIPGQIVTVEVQAEPSGDDVLAHALAARRLRLRERAI